MDLISCITFRTSRIKGMNKASMIQTMIAILMLTLCIFLLPSASNASCCFNYNCDVEDKQQDTCPMSGYGCSWVEEQHECHNTGCNQAMNCAVAFSTCYIYRNCDELIGGGPCSPFPYLNYITSKWSYAKDLGTEDACDISECFNCPRENPPIVCGFSRRVCPPW